ncbi:MAG: integrase arm-type DNA-binding domain-containing protein [Xanthobacteraceae bacterium]|jgi:integrase
MQKVLTDADCKAKPPAAGRVEIADLRQAGLVLRITHMGSRTFGFRFRHPHNRKTLRATIGTYPATTLETARKRAREMAAQVEARINPIEARATERQTAHTRTFSALAARYLKEHAERHKRPRSAEEDRRNLALHVLPKWGKRDFRNIRRADVIELIESIVSAGKHVAANRVHSLISKVFNFAVDADLLDTNPAARLKKRGVENSRKRVLNDAELPVFWRGIVVSPVSKPVGLALRLALLTGARASEVACARKSEFVDLDKPAQAAWLIPGERTKNKRDHLIPLSRLALETVKAAFALTSDETEFLFPARYNTSKALDGHALTAAMARFCSEWKNPPSPHDLRRTINTRLAELGIRKEVRDRCLNHVTGLRDPESKHYNIYEFKAEKRKALGKWCNALAAIIAGRR